MRKSWSPGAYAGLLALLSCTVPTWAMAQSPSAELLLPCREIVRSKDRLECYDRQMATLFGVDEKAEARQTQARAAEFGRSASDDDALAELSATIGSVQYNPVLQLAVIALDNGQVWETTSNGTLLQRLRAGQQVRITPSMLGGFRLRIEGVRGFQGVKRTR